jgi:hypothetical protein
MDYHRNFNMIQSTPQTEINMSANEVVEGNTKFGTPQKIMAFGSITKFAVGKLEIPFGVTFSQPPTVFLTPHWPNGQVGFIETIVSVDKVSCVISSQNAGPNYDVHWLAIGT